MSFNSVRAVFVGKVKTVQLAGDIPKNWNRREVMLQLMAMAFQYSYSMFRHPVYVWSVRIRVSSSEQKLCMAE